MIFAHSVSARRLRTLVQKQFDAPAQIVNFGTNGLLSQKGLAPARSQRQESEFLFMIDFESRANVVNERCARVKSPMDENGSCLGSKFALLQQLQRIEKPSFKKPSCRLHPCTYIPCKQYS